MPWDTDPMMELEAEEDERAERAWAADAEMAELARAGRAIDRARKAGRCTHGSAAGYRQPPVYPEQHGLRKGQLRCTNPDFTPPGHPDWQGCGAVFDSEQHWHAAMDAAIYGGE